MNGQTTVGTTDRPTDDYTLYDDVIMSFCV